MKNSKERIFITGASGFIGTNLIDLLINNNLHICNFDKNEPNKKNHNIFWIKGNLLNISDIENALHDFKPTIVIHLAARTDTLSDKLDDYIDNTKGTENLIFCLKNLKELGRVIITSTQYVYKSDEKPLPTHDDEYLPYTAYGQSKVITEQLTREADLQCCWTIVRPANIWGPWHLRYPVELWKIIDKGMYIHPSITPVIRTYGYVHNVVHQILQIMKADSTLINKQTYYLGDVAIDSYIWLNSISKILTGKVIKRVPSYVFKMPAILGDLLRMLGIPSPLYTARFKNMIENYPAPTNKTISEFGVYNSNLDDNIKETIQWLHSEGKDLFDYWKMK